MNVIVGRANIVKTIEDTEAPASPVIFNSVYEEAEGIGAGHFVSFFLREVFPSRFFRRVNIVNVLASRWP